MLLRERGGDWKVLASQDFVNIELYNPTADLKEASELIANEPEKLEQFNVEVEKEGPDWWNRLSPNGGGPVTKK